MPAVETLEPPSTAPVSSSPSVFARAARLLTRALSGPLGPTRARALVGRVYTVLTMVLYSVQAQYERTLLGLLWALVTPLLFLAVYLPLFTIVFNVRMEGAESDPLHFPLYVIGGFLAWNGFTEGFNSGATSLVMNPGVVKHSPAPPAILPLVKVLSSFVALCAGLVIFVLLLTAVGRFPGTRLFLLPVAVGLLFVFTWGLALMVSALAMLLRDVLQIVTTVLLVEFFACPLIYSRAMVLGPHGDRLDLLLMLEVNPLTPFFDLFRAGLLPDHPYTWGTVVLAACWASLALAVGRYVFLRLEGSFADAS